MHKIFSGRAECSVDVERLRRALALPVGITMKRYEGVPDVKFELRIEADLETIRAAIRKVPDGHVMLQTLRPGSLADNSLERDYEAT